MSKDMVSEAFKASYDSRKLDLVGLVVPVGVVANLIRDAEQQARMQVLWAAFERVKEVATLDEAKDVLRALREMYQ